MRQMSCVGAPDPTPMLADGLPVHVQHDRTLRVKIIDACGMTCTFCHNEGTPVAADNLGRAAAGGDARGGCRFTWRAMAHAFFPPRSHPATTS